MEENIDSNGIIVAWPMKWRKKCQQCDCYYLPTNKHECTRWVLLLKKFQRERMKKDKDNM